MRLLSRSNGVLSLTPDREPDEAYAVLSHTWGADEEEVTLEDIRTNAYSTKVGYRKLEFCLGQAQKDGYKYVWIDTCCIDKRDRSELGEAINRMFDWYAKATVCYVYLSDITEDTVRQSRWFKRGWTLPELLAPPDVRFYSSNGAFLGDRSTLRQEILSATQIDTTIDLADVPIAERYRYSLTRQTTKAEDASYCLLGLLEVSLLFNYGEGAETAQERLIQEVEKEHGRQVGKKIRSIAAQRSSTDNEAAHEPKMTLGKLMKTLEFEGMYSRHANIKDPFRDTCKWILAHDSYQTWSRLQSETRFLWIKGHPGSGKSTLIRFVDKESGRLDANIRISFYFNARGHVLEKTTLGMYLSLLRQLLEHAPHIRSVLVSHINDQALMFRPWTVRSLQNALKFCIKSISSSVQCFIDALDECDIAEVQEMVYFFEDLPYNVPLFVCFASRHYPEISIQQSIELLLDTEQDHNEDLRDYVNGRLDVDQLSLGDELKRRVVAKANGIFFWAVLVVELLNKELRAGTMYNVQRRLEELPTQLSDLLWEIIWRDTEELPRFQLCLQWILFAKRPLKLQEYYFAMVTSLSEAGVTDEEAYTQPWHHKTISPKSMTKFVTSSSRGLAEVVSDGVKMDSTVQFIHESVRDFLLRHQGLQNVHTHVKGDLTGWIHENLRCACQSYLATNFMVRTDLTKDTVPWRTLPRVQWPQILMLHSTYPFLGYAWDNIVHHAEQAAVSQAQEDFLDEFDVDLFKDLDSIDRRRRPQVDRFELMHILARFDAARLIRTAHKRGIDVNDVQAGISPLHVAIKHSNRNAARELLACGAHVVSTNGNCSPTLLMTIKQNNGAMCQMLLDHGAEVNAVDEETGGTPLQMALSWRHAEICQKLLTHGADTKAIDQNGRTPLQIALDNGENTICEILIKNGAEVNTTGDTGQTPLQMAISSRNVTMCKTLLQNGAEVNIVDKNCRTALHIAVCRDYNAAMYEPLLDDTLRDSGVETNQKSPPMIQPWDDVAICHMLLDNGVDVNATDSFGLTALHMAGSTESDAMCEMLLQNGAEVNAVDKIGRTPLQMAVSFNNAAVCDMLLGSGAEVNTIDNKTGQTPLQIAVFQKNAAICEMLLDRGAEVNTIADKADRTPLQLALSLDNADICRMLLGNGADATAVAANGLCPLRQAIEFRAINCMELLLKYGAAAETPDSNGETAFFAALDNAAVFEVLLSHNGDKDATVRCINSLGLLSKMKQSKPVNLCHGLIRKKAIDPAIYPILQHSIQTKSHSWSRVLRDEPPAPSRMRDKVRFLFFRHSQQR